MTSQPAVRLNTISRNNGSSLCDMLRRPRFQKLYHRFKTGLLGAFLIASRPKESLRYRAYCCPCHGALDHEQSFAPFHHSKDLYLQQSRNVGNGVLLWDVSSKVVEGYPVLCKATIRFDKPPYHGKTGWQRFLECCPLCIGIDRSKNIPVYTVITREI